MKLNLLIVLLIVVNLVCTQNSADIAGTADVTNSGKIFGKLLNEDKTVVDDTVTVTLYAVNINAAGLAKRTAQKNIPIKTCHSTDGYYEFDSLVTGMYEIVATKEDIAIGEEKAITLGINERKEINITIVIIINQTFNIWTDNNQNIVINNFYMNNGSVEKTDSGYVLSYAETDTLIMELEIKKDDIISTVKVRVIRQSDGTSTFEVIEGSDELIITQGTEPLNGYIGDLIISIKNPGAINVESNFDTSAVPVKSE